MAQVLRRYAEGAGSAPIAAAFGVQVGVVENVVDRLGRNDREHAAALAGSYPPPPQAAIAEHIARQRQTVVPPGQARVAGMVRRDAIDARVADGADWLDRVRPGWADGVGIDDLEMDHPHRCPFGQVFGDFFTAPVTLEEAADFGCFSYARLTGRGDDPAVARHDREELAQLAEAWRAEVPRRRAAPS